jgi:cytosine/adenosine deaminase-related metal-dependent hydrolase
MSFGSNTAVGHCPGTDLVLQHGSYPLQNTHSHPGTVIAYCMTLRGAVPMYAACLEDR